MENNPIRNLQYESDLRIIQSNSVEPVVYQSNQSIVSSYGGKDIYHHYEIFLSNHFTSFVIYK